MIGGYKPALTLKTLGEWDKEVGVPLSTTMKVIIENTGKTGEQAVSNCIVKMAQVMSKTFTPAGKKRRPVFDMVKDGLGPFINVFSQRTGIDRITRIYKWRFNPGAANPLSGTWKDAQTIANAGMAKRSWFWGIRGLPGAPYAMGGKPYPGIARMITLRGRGEMAFGQILENRLAYITRIIPSDYEARAVRAVGNQVLGQYRDKMEKDFHRDIQRNLRSVVGGLMKAVA